MLHNIKALAIAIILGAITALIVTSPASASPQADAQRAAAKEKREFDARMRLAYARYLARHYEQQQQQAIIDSLFDIEMELLRMRMQQQLQEQMRPIR